MTVNILKSVGGNFHPNLAFFLRLPPFSRPQNIFPPDHTNLFSRFYPHPISTQHVQFPILPTPTRCFADFTPPNSFFQTNFHPWPVFPDSNLSSKFTPPNFSRDPPTFLPSFYSQPVLETPNLFWDPNHFGGIFQIQTCLVDFISAALLWNSPKSDSFIHTKKQDACGIIEVEMGGNMQQTVRWMFRSS